MQTSLMSLRAPEGGAASPAESAPVRPDESMLPAGSAQTYVCEQCGTPCDKKTFTTCICPACQWRVLRKLATATETREYSTD